MAGLLTQSLVLVCIFSTAWSSCALGIHNLARNLRRSWICVPISAESVLRWKTNVLALWSQLKNRHRGNTYTYDWFKQNVFRKQKQYAYFSVTRKHTRTHNYGHSLLCNRIYQVATFIWSLVSKLFVDFFCSIAFVCVSQILLEHWSYEIN